MSNVVRTAGVAGTFNYTLSQDPAETPTMTIYSDAARTVVAVAAATLTTTPNPAVFTAAYPATLAAGTYFLSFSVVMTTGQPAYVDNDDTLELRAVSGSAGSTYITRADLRALPNLGDTVKFTDAELDDAIEWFETVFEDYVGMAFVPRSTTERLVGAGSVLRLSRWPVRSVSAVRVYTSPTVNTPYTAAELADLIVTPLGEVRRYSLGYWAADVEVDYVHGQAAPPADLKREAKVAIQEHLMENHSGRPTDRTYGTASDGVFVRSILPDGDKHPFGIASVDALAVRYRDKYRLPAVA